MYIRVMSIEIPRYMSANARAVLIMIWGEIYNSREVSLITADETICVL